MSEKSDYKKYGNISKTSRYSAKPYDKNQSILNRVKSAVRSYLTPPSWVQSLLNLDNHIDNSTTCDGDVYNENGEGPVQEFDDEITVEHDGYQATFSKNEIELLANKVTNQRNIETDSSGVKRVGLKRNVPNHEVDTNDGVESTSSLQMIKSREPLNKRRALDTTIESPEIQSTSSKVHPSYSLLHSQNLSSSSPKFIIPSSMIQGDKMISSKENGSYLVPNKNDTKLKTPSNDEVGSTSFRLACKLKFPTTEPQEQLSTSNVKGSNHSRISVKSPTYFLDKLKQKQDKSYMISPFYNKPIAYGGAAAYQNLTGGTTEVKNCQQITPSCLDPSTLGLTNSTKRILKMLEKSDEKKSKEAMNVNRTLSHLSSVSDLYKKFSMHDSPVSSSKRPGPPTRNLPTPVTLVTNSYRSKIDCLTQKRMTQDEHDNVESGAGSTSKKWTGKMRHEREKYHQVMDRPDNEDDDEDEGNHTSYVRKISTDALSEIKLPPVTMKPFTTTSSSSTRSTQQFNSTTSQQRERSYVFSAPDIITNDRNVGKNTKFEKQGLPIRNLLSGHVTKSYKSSLTQNKNDDVDADTDNSFKRWTGKMRHEKEKYHQVMDRPDNEDDDEDEGNHTSYVRKISSDALSEIKLPSVKMKPFTTTSSSTRSTQQFNSTTSQQQEKRSYVFRPPDIVSNDKNDAPATDKNVVTSEQNQNVVITNDKKFVVTNSVVTTEQSENIEQKNKSEGTSLMAMFAKKPGEWTCDVCMIRNQAADVLCAACQSPKPGASAAGAPSTATTSSSADTTSNSSTTQQITINTKVGGFSFGGNQGGVGTAAPMTFNISQFGQSSDANGSKEDRLKEEVSSTGFKPTFDGFKPSFGQTCNLPTSSSSAFVSATTSTASSNYLSGFKFGATANESLPIGKIATTSFAATTMSATITTMSSSAMFATSATTMVVSTLSGPTFTFGSGNKMPSFGSAMPSAAFAGFGSSGVTSLSTTTTTSSVVFGNVSTSLNSNSIFINNNIVDNKPMFGFNNNATSSPSSSLLTSSSLSLLASSSSLLASSSSLPLLVSSSLPSKSSLTSTSVPSSSVSIFSSGTSSATTTTISNLFQFGNSLSTLTTSSLLSTPFSASSTMTSNKVPFTFNAPQLQPQLNFGSSTSSIQQSTFFGQFSSSSASLTVTTSTNVFNFGQQPTAAVFGQPQQPQQQQNVAPTFELPQKSNAIPSFTFSANNPTTSLFGSSSSNSMFDGNKRSISDDMMVDNDSSNNQLLLLQQQQQQQQQQQTASIFGVQNNNSATPTGFTFGGAPSNNFGATNQGFNFGSSSTQSSSVFTFGQQPSQQPPQQLQPQQPLQLQAQQPPQQLQSQQPLQLQTQQQSASWNVQSSFLNPIPSFNFAGSSNVSFNSTTPQFNAPVNPNLSHRVIKKAARRTKK